MLGVFLLPAFTRLGHESQDLLSPCDEMGGGGGGGGGGGEWSLNPC